MKYNLICFIQSRTSRKIVGRALRRRAHANTRGTSRIISTHPQSSSSSTPSPHSSFDLMNFPTPSHQRFIRTLSTAVQSSHSVSKFNFVNLHTMIRARIVCTSAHKIRSEWPIVPTEWVQYLSNGRTLHCDHPKQHEFMGRALHELGMKHALSNRGNLGRLPGFLG